MLQKKVNDVVDNDRYGSTHRTELSRSDETKVELAKVKKAKPILKPEVNEDHL